MLEWVLRKAMLERGVRSGAELMRLLWDKSGYRMSAPSISALINDQPNQMKSDTLDALCTALECSPGDLWVYTSPEQTKGA